MKPQSKKKGIRSRELTYPPKMAFWIFLFPRWGMLLPWRVIQSILHQPWALRSHHGTVSLLGTGRRWIWKKRRLVCFFFFFHCPKIGTNIFSQALHYLLPGKLTWNLNTTQLQRKIILPNLDDCVPSQFSRVYSGLNFGLVGYMIWGDCLLC